MLLIKVRNEMPLDSELWTLIPKAFRVFCIMGLIFPSRRRGSGMFGLLFWLALLVVGSVYIAKHSASVQTNCLNITQSLGGYGGALCRAVADVAATVAHGAQMVAQVTGMEWLEEYRNDWSLRVDNSGIRDRWRALGAQLDEATNVSGPNLGGGVSMESVRAMMGGATPTFGGGTGGQYQGAMSYFLAGQSLMSGQGGFGQSGTGAMDWYKRGASMGQYGLLSQVKLGSMYMTGGGGVPADYGQAYSYNLQALNSLQALQSAGTPEAQMTLDALAVSPTELQMQLNKAIADLKYRMQTGQ